MRVISMQEKRTFRLRCDRHARLLRIVSPVLLLAAGCGGVGLPSGGDSGALSIHAAAAAIDTNTPDQLSASLSSGEPAAVVWSLVTGQNNASIGQGSINANGVYTPPTMLSQDSVDVEVRATLRNDPNVSATMLLYVTPGFVQALTPEEANLAPGGTLSVTAELSEVNSGEIHWSLAGSPNGAADPAAAYGSIGDSICHHSSQTYTYCTATYTAPAAKQAGNGSLFLLATPAREAASIATLHILLNDGEFNTSSLANQAVQTGDVEMGSSGGNANDYDSSQDAQGSRYVNDCCGGTLGALVEDRSGNPFILSNNHVLAESDQAQLGDTIVQPALVDSNCDPQAGQAVGSLRYVVPLASSQTNVDAALAAASPAVDQAGKILEIGAPAGGVLNAAAPAAGNGEALTADLLNQLRVVKSGRTTGLTCSTVSAVDLRVQVDYYYDCAETLPYYTKTYTGQIGIPGASFADSGDSGALVLDAGNAKPIGLLFASGGPNSASGGEGFSIANPIQDVLTELGQKSQAQGQQFQIVGGAAHPITCSDYDLQPSPSSTLQGLSAAQASAANAAVDLANETLMKPDSGILGFGVGRSLDDPNEAALIVYVNRGSPPVAVPKLVGGVRTLVISSDAASVSAKTAPLTVRPAKGIDLPAATLRAAAQIQQRYASQLMADPALFGVGVTQSYDNPAEAALLVLVDEKETPASMPDTVGGLRIRYLRMNRLHVTRSRSANPGRPTRCELLSKDNGGDIGGKTAAWKPAATLPLPLP